MAPWWRGATTSVRQIHPLIWCVGVGERTESHVSCGASENQEGPERRMKTKQADRGIVKRRIIGTLFLRVLYAGGRATLLDNSLFLGFG